MWQETNIYFYTNLRHVQLYKIRVCTCKKRKRKEDEYHSSLKHTMIQNTPPHENTFKTRTVLEKKLKRFRSLWCTGGLYVLFMFSSACVQSVAALHSPHVYAHRCDWVRCNAVNEATTDLTRMNSNTSSKNININSSKTCLILVLCCVFLLIFPGLAVLVPLWHDADAVHSVVLVWR